MRADRTGAWKWAAAAGGLIGLAALTRSNGLVLLVPTLLAIGMARGRPAKERLRTAGVVAGVLALTLVPWTVRNASEFGRVLPLGTLSGYTLAGQYNPTAAGPGEFEAIWRTPQTAAGFDGLFGRPGTDEAEVDAELRSRGLRYALDHPRYVVRVLSLNTRRQFDLGPNFEFTRATSYGEMGIPTEQHAQVSNWVHLLLLLAVAGAVVLVRRGRAGPLWLWAVPALLFASAVLVAGAPRYRTPVDPFLLLLAGAALSAAWAKIAGTRRSS